MGEQNKHLDAKSSFANAQKYPRSIFVVFVHLVLQWQKLKPARPPLLALFFAVSPRVCRPSGFEPSWFVFRGLALLGGPCGPPCLPYNCVAVFCFCSRVFTGCVVLWDSSWGCVVPWDSSWLVVLSCGTLLDGRTKTDFDNVQWSWTYF